MPPPRSSPELAPYLRLHGRKDVFHPEAGPCFVCEGRFLVEAALEAGREGRLRVLSVLTTPSLAPSFRSLLPDGTQLLVADEKDLQELVGFPFHRGVLGCAAIPPAPEESTILEANRLLVLPRLDDLENLGLLMRSAAALGMDAVILERGPGPFERRSVRVAMGAAWRIPVRRVDDAKPLLESWRIHRPRDHAEIVAAALADDAMDARTWVPAPRTALVLGPEGPGLDAEWLAFCDRRLMIPMHRSMDSLNVAAAGAILMWRMAGGPSIDDDRGPSHLTT